MSQGASTDSKEQTVGTSSRNKQQETDNKKQERMMGMAWELDADRPIYAQLVERIQREIVSGQYRPGEKLPSVRDIATVAAVNPNTMQKAFAELERSGLIVTQRTSGRTVTEDTELIRNTREQLAVGHVRNFMNNMQELGYQKEEIKDFFDKIQPQKDVSL